MILNILTIVMLLVITGLWCTSQKGRGFFSSFLNMICVIAAGAIAFGVWEPVTMLVIENFGTMSNNLVERIAPTAALLLPFSIALAILRLTVDAFVGKNVDFDDATNFIGGMCCGVVAAAITAGTVVVGLNFLGVGRTLLGHDYLGKEAGNLVYSSNLWLPVDKATVALYERLSTAGFATSTPLAEFAPDLHEQAVMSRAVYETEKDSKKIPARASLDPKNQQLQIKGRLTVTGELPDLLTDRWFPDRTHTVRTIDDEPPAPGSNAEIVFMQVNSTGAAEKSGQIIFTPGQIRMIATNRDGEGVGIYPHAVFAKATQSALALTRFRFDDTNATIASPGRGGNHVFGFEFLVPPGYTPDSVIVRNIRFSLDGVTQYPAPGEALAGAAARDSAIAGGEVIAALDISMGGVNLAAPTGTPVATDNPIAQSSPVIQTPTLPDRFGITRNAEGGLTLVEVRRGRSSTELVIRSGRGTFSADAIGNQVGASSIVAKSFEQPDGQRVLMIPLKKRKQDAITPFGRAVQELGTTAQPLLYNSQSNKWYQAFGFVHINQSDNVTIQYDFTKPITNLSRDLPDVNMNGNGSGIYLVFLVERGVSITDFVLNIEGESAPRNAVRFTPPIPAG
ncbi:MAG: hypothetical protein ACF8MJ_06895 [Phycisphaerales bacterium JB050]